MAARTKRCGYGVCSAQSCSIFKLHPRTVHALSFGWLSDKLYSGSYAGLLACWDTGSRQLVWKQLTGVPISDIHAASEKQIITVDLNNSIVKWDFRNGQQNSKTTMLPARPRLNKARFSRDAKYVIRLIQGTAEKYGSEVTVVDLATGRSVAFLAAQDNIRSVFPFAKADKILVHSQEDGIILWKRTSKTAQKPA